MGKASRMKRERRGVEKYVTPQELCKATVAALIAFRAQHCGQMGLTPDEFMARQKEVSDFIAPLREKMPADVVIWAGSLFASVLDNAKMRPE